MFLVTPEVTIAPLAPALLGASIDLPRSGARSNARALTVAGWVVARNTEVREVRVLSGGQLVRRLRPNEDRPDVAAHLHGAPGSLRPGFRTTVDTTARTAQELAIRAVLADRSEVAIGRVHWRRSWLSGNHPSERGVVSVVIACFNQAHFLGAAIDSCLAQTYRPVEIVVVDDGSTDNTQELSSRYKRVRYVRQENGGLATARNTGIRRSSGEYLTFLDADDRLVPDALRVNVELLQVCEECAFVSGEHCYIDVDGHRTGEWVRPVVHEDHYEALLKGNYIGCHAAVTYRRAIFQHVGGFDPALTACEDYDMYLRIARLFPVKAHGRVVAEYRRHGGSMSDNPRGMLAAARAVLARQRQWTRGSGRRRTALREGLRYWQDYYGPSVAAHARTSLTTGGRRREGVAGVLWLARYAPRHLLSALNPVAGGQ